MDECSSYVNLMKSIFIETNFKLRREGIIFLQIYFKNLDLPELIESDRYQNIYLPELLGYLEDEDQQLVCDAIDAVTPLIELIDEQVLIKYFIPQVLPFLDFKQHTTLEITDNFVENFGSIAYNLHKRGFLMQNKQEYISFFKEMLNHEDLKMKIKAVYILPCIHLIYQDCQEECEIDFAQTYLKLLSEDGKIRRKAALSLHEVFLIYKDTEEDTSTYKECYLDLMLDDTPKIMKMVNTHLS